MNSPNDSLVASSFAHCRSHQPEVDQPLSKQPIDGINYVWMRTPPYFGNGTGRIRNMAAFVGRLFRFSKRLVALSRPDVIIASSTYPLDIYPAHWMAKRMGARLIFEVHDLWPLSPMELGGFSRRHPFIVVMQRAENFAYRVSGKVVSILPKTKDHMVDHGLSPDRFEHIANGVDPDSDNGEDAPPSCIDEIERLRRQGKFVVVYAGAFGLANCLATLLEVAERLKDKKIAFVLAGQGPEEADLRRRAERMDLEVHFVGYIQKPQIRSLLLGADACYIGFKRQSLYRFGVCTNKVLDYMMAGKPVIQAIEVENDIVSESGCGICVAPDDPGMIASAILSLARMPHGERQEMGCRGREYVMKHHDYRVLAQKFLSVMRECAPVTRPEKGALQ